jgi:hypothetical protein
MESWKKPHPANSTTRAYAMAQTGSSTNLTHKILLANVSVPKLL